MPRSIIIDGYNLAHALRETRSLVRSDQQAARRTLIGLLQRYKKASPADITVVFDGAGEQDGQTRRVAGISVLFSRPPQSADDRIRALVNSARDPGRILVVSSDRAVWRHARNKGAEHITAQQFGDRLFAALERQPAGEEKPREVDVEKWQRIFDLPASDKE
jgi:uncharacterized protein